MSSLESWTTEVGSAVAALGRGIGPDVDRPADAALSRQVARAGFPGVLPLWSGTGGVVGLVAQPNADHRTWPGVLVQDGQGLTLASDARTLLPQLLVNRMLSNDPESAGLLAGRWSAAGAGALALHHALGGSDDTLDAVVAAASDPAARQTFKYREDAQAEFQAAHSRLFRTIDASPPFVRFADWLDACIGGRCTEPGDTAAFGAWERRVLALSSRNRFANPAPLLSTPQVLRLIEGNAGIDSGIPSQASWMVQAGGASGEATLAEAAAALQTQPAPADPVSAAILTALLTEHTSYRGLAHAEAVPLLDEGGEPERAWGILQSAAWWSARNTGETPPAMFEGARFLATRHGWTDVAWVAERAAGAGG